MPILEIENLKKSFDSKMVLNQLSFTISKSEVYGLLGPNGSGKTTTINIICNLLQPDSGNVSLNSTPVSNVAKNFIGVSPQEISLYDNLTCFENLWFFATIYGLAGKHKKEQVQKCLEAVNMIDSINTLVGQLSGGMKRRVNIAVALLHSPELVILDEPTAGLDVEERYRLWELIRFFRNQGRTILLTTHNLDEAENLCTRIGILKDGRIIAEGTMEDLRKIISAVKLAVIESANREAVFERAVERGFTYREYSGNLYLWLPKPLELTEVANIFNGIPLSSISLRPVNLEHIYFEVTQNAANRTRTG